MYGYDGVLDWLQWLAITKDPATLTPEDQKHYKIYPAANTNAHPTNCIAKDT